MVSIVWVIYAFLAGSCAGAILIGLMAINAHRGEPLLERTSEPIVDDHALQLLT